MSRSYVSRKFSNSECVSVVQGCVNSDRKIDRLNILKIVTRRRLMDALLCVIKLNGNQCRVVYKTDQL